MSTAAIRLLRLDFDEDRCVCYTRTGNVYTLLWLPRSYLRVEAEGLKVMS